jgi:polysaccharide export outer membrane protein
MMAMLSILSLISCAYPPLDNEAELPDDYTYIIGPGDGLEIFVWDNPDISRSVTVRPDGKINTPLLDDLIASGKTPSQLARMLEEKLSKFVREPLVAVMVGGFQGIYEQQVRVIGQIRGGGGGGGSGGGSGNQAAGSAMAFPYKKGMTLLDLMVEIGSFSQYADVDRVSIIRKIDGEAYQFGLRIYDLVDYGDLTANVKIMPGDIMIVPEAFF